MDKKRLSVIPYYGGKAKMAEFITSRLDYDNTTVFVEPFGGGGRILLNKPRHPAEVYNDLDVGICKLFEMLSNPDTAKQLIATLYYESEFSLKQFEWAQKVYRHCTWDAERRLRSQLREVLVQHVKLSGGKQISSQTAGNLIEILWSKLKEAYADAYSGANTIGDEQSIDLYKVPLPFSYGPPTDDKKYKAVVLQALFALFEHLGRNTMFRQEFEILLRDWSVSLWKKEHAILPQSLDEESIPSYSDMELAIATYITFQQSRDGMGLAFSPQKFLTQAQYKNRITNLYDCAKRLEGVQVHQIDGNIFIKSFMFIDKHEMKGKLPAKGFPALFNEWIHREDVMIYADPSYIDPNDEKRILFGQRDEAGKPVQGEAGLPIEIAADKSITDAIKAKNRPLPKNLGSVYARSFTYEEQESFIRSIQKAKAHILLCNYDLYLYDYYLTPELGWRREEFETTTSVGGKAGNKRTEVIWMNY